MSEYIYSFDGVTEQGIETYMRREEIVRCRDCKKCNIGWCVHFNNIVKPDGFCKWGVRRDV